MRQYTSNNLADKRILIVLTTLDMGGAERQALHLASYLQDRKHARVAIVALFGGTGKQSVRHLCVDRRLPCLRLSMPEHINAVPSFRSIRQFARELRLLQPDILLPYTSMPNVLCGITWRMVGARTCIWNQRDAGLELPHERWQIAAFANTPLFLANARSGVDCLVNDHGVPIQQVRLVFNGVTLPPARESRDAMRQRLGIAPNAFVGVMLANIHRFKDHETLIRAWKLVNQQAASMKPTLLFAGHEVDSTALRALVTDLGLDAGVGFLGPVDDVASLLNAVDISLFSSDNEGMPNAVLESMAASRAVVATDIPGCHDALGEGYPYLVPAKNPDIFARFVVELSQNAKLAAIGQQLKARVNSEFTVEKMCLQTCGILEEAISGG